MSRQPGEEDRDRKLRVDAAAQEPDGVSAPRGTGAASTVQTVELGVALLGNVVAAGRLKQERSLGKPRRSL